MPLQITEEVPIGEIKICDNASAVMVVNNLSSGIVVVLYDRIKKMGGMLHVMLPDSSAANMPEEQENPKFADVGIPMLIQQFMEAGGQKQNLIVRIVGGAQLFNFGGGANTLNLGARNAVAIRSVLSKHGLPIAKADVGGNKGRKVRLQLANGKLAVKVPGQDSYEI